MKCENLTILLPEFEYNLILKLPNKQIKLFKSDMQIRNLINEKMYYVLNGIYKVEKKVNILKKIRLR